MAEAAVTAVTAVAEAAVTAVTAVAEAAVTAVTAAAATPLRTRRGARQGRRLDPPPRPDILPRRTRPV